MADLKGKRVLLTAGPTWEALDPVRGITNHSSGKMGYAIATAAKAVGAEVTLISGPVCLDAPEGLQTIQIQSALQMYEAVHAQIEAQNIDVFIGVAAVADYRPAEVQPQKIKKSSEEIQLTLIKNPDIIASVAALETKRPYTVGFAAETENTLANAESKLIAKQLDLIVANDVSESGVGFGSDQNRLCVLQKKTNEAGEPYVQKQDLGKHTKKVLAQNLMTFIAKQMAGKLVGK